MEDTEINIIKEKSMDELRFNIVNSAIEDNTLNYFLAIVQSITAVGGFFVCFCSEKGLCSHKLGRRGVIHKR